MVAAESKHSRRYIKNVFSLAARSALGWLSPIATPPRGHHLGRHRRRWVRLRLAVCDRNGQPRHHCAASHRQRAARHQHLFCRQHIHIRRDAGTLRASRRKPGAANLPEMHRTGPIYCFGVVMLFPFHSFLQLPDSTATVLTWIINLTTAAGVINYIVMTTT
ncbi:uncharacterized protein BO97DRAFT_454641 [Aspergillus homomorphus CBS 101889]|uniref:Uncharacterized protein n=1 Tax=Aspergillus homomorphus (strain CBS 101889) TaxID=1450537 RepID=A0A395HU99_ASPHC|nr:hypothetical protein BO97DRAFT_454641 [Aspergillus homomorphus CBS 101889]RAL10965.1 hypothetical protein BO97DRAFT_454641 [Aspergillus homomorphus CBS 101889]